MLDCIMGRGAMENDRSAMPNSLSVILHSKPAALNSCCNLLSLASACAIKLARTGSLDGAGADAAVTVGWVSLACRASPSSARITDRVTISSAFSSTPLRPLPLPRPNPKPWRNRSLRDTPRKPNTPSICETIAKPGAGCSTGGLVSRCEAKIPRSQRLTRQNPRSDVRSMNQPVRYHQPPRQPPNVSRTNCHQEERKPLSGGIRHKHIRLFFRERRPREHCRVVPSSKVAIICIRLCRSSERRLRICCPTRPPSSRPLTIPIATHPINPAAQRKPILNQRDAKPRPGAEACRVSGMEEVGKEEADELEGDRDEHVPEEGEERAGREGVDDHFADGVWGKGGVDSRLPIWGDGVGLGGGIGGRCFLPGIFWHDVCIVTLDNDKRIAYPHIE